MFTLKTEAAFDSAHFLYGYNGKCANIHGHRWRIIAEIKSDTVASEGQCRGMVVDFGDLKNDLKSLADRYDHSLIYEKGSLKPETIKALESENFHIIEVDFRPTAENFAKSFFTQLKDCGYNAEKVTVYETPNNCASYSEE